MTWRSVILGLLGAACLCGFNYINDNILKQTYLVGNNLPVAVYGALVIFVVLVNPLLARASKRLALGGRELAVILCLTLAACCIPASGLLRTFTNSIVLPYHYDRLNPGWRENQVIEVTPKPMLADVSVNEDTVLNGFVQGLGETNRNISFFDVPWYAWTRTLLFWLPVILALWLGLIALSVVLHKQWSEHELLPYPIADFADSLLPEEGQATSSLLRNRLFWVGTLVVFLLHFNNFLALFFPEKMIQIRRQLNFTPMIHFLPYLQRGGGTRLLAPVIYFSVIGFSYFIPKDVSLSIGIGPYLWATVAGLFATYGVPLTAPLEGAGWYIALKPQTFILFGANLGVFIVVLYCGRHYYLKIFRRALFLPPRIEEERAAVCGARLFLACMALFWIQLVTVGLDWQLVAMYLAVLLIFYVVMSRVFAETGLFYMQPFFFPCVVIWGVLGSQALGPKAMMILFMLTTVLLIDPRESLMPFVVNSLKLLELRKVRLGRSAWLFAAAVVIGLAVALPITLYFQYNLGYAKWDGWACKAVPQMAFKNVVATKEKLAAQGSLETAEGLRGWQRFGHMAPNPLCMGGLAAGLALALLFYAGRLRIPWWPLHPVLFLTWATEPPWRLCGSFMIGWLIKTLVVKYGGSKTYQKLKPLMYGLIAGEIFGAVVPSIVGAVYYLVTGEPPERFMVLPG